MVNRGEMLTLWYERASLAGNGVFVGLVDLGVSGSQFYDVCWLSTITLLIVSTMRIWSFETSPIRREMQIWVGGFQVVSYSQAIWSQRCHLQVEWVFRDCLIGVDFSLRLCPYNLEPFIKRTINKRLETSEELQNVGRSIGVKFHKCRPVCSQRHINWSWRFKFGV